MRVLVMNVSSDRAAVMNSEFRVVVDVAVIDVRRIVRIISPRRFCERRQVIWKTVNSAGSGHSRVRAIRIGRMASIAKLGSGAKHWRLWRHDCCGTGGAPAAW